MKKCQTCGTLFPTYAKIDGQVRNLHSRKRCFKCSPFGKHNTSKIIYKEGNHTCARCGRIYLYDRKRGHSHSQCNSCNATIRRIKLKQKMVEYLGGKCNICGYNNALGALQFHHLDPSKKDLNLCDAYRHTWNNIKKELGKCSLLCANCHAEKHDLSRGRVAGISTPAIEFNSLRGR